MRDPYAHSVVNPTKAHGIYQGLRSRRSRAATDAPVRSGYQGLRRQKRSSLKLDMQR